ncbi:MAG: hypothetical protein J0H88_13780 [Sphingomonadales bacterium]|nr:hypothetical protein [Sphingomonadales bacterium]
MNSPDLSSIARGVPDVDLLRALAATNRTALERMIEVSIDILDEVDGDADDQDGCGAEDEPCAYFALEGRGAGCLVSDNDFDEVWNRPNAESDA